MFRRSGGIMMGLMGMALSVLSATAGRAEDPAMAVQHGGGLPEIMAAEHPGVAARSAFAGPWRYGCAYPGRDSTQATQFCTIQLEKQAGTSMDGGFLLFTHATPDLRHVPLAGRSWDVTLNLPLSQRFNLQAAPRLVVDQITTIPLKMESCDATGCLARESLSGSSLQALQSGRQAELVAKTASGASWQYSFPLADIQQGIRQIGTWSDHGELAPAATTTPVTR